jgi:hypothetical protein
MDANSSILYALQGVFDFTIRDNAYYIDSSRGGFSMYFDAIEMRNISAIDGDSLNCLDILEGLISIDKDLYRLISLMEFLSPSLFGDMFIKEHLNYMFSYFSLRRLGFLVNPSILFEEGLSMEKVFNYCGTAGLDLLSFQIDELGEEYTVYKFDNVVSVNGVGEMYTVPFSTFKMNRDGLCPSQIDYERLYTNMYNIYIRMLSFREMQKNKLTVMNNIEYILNLQHDRVKAFMTDFNLEVSII